MLHMTKQELITLQTQLEIALDALGKARRIAPSTQITNLEDTTYTVLRTVRQEKDKAA